jgi:tRNA pseudouridine32 synthase/23S rRNA pseudouridine746 synthase
VLDALCARFAAIPREVWLDRMRRGLVMDVDGRAIEPERGYSAGICVQYYRELPNEAAIPFRERVLHLDADLMIVDKPHFLPVMPAGSFVRETLITRLIERFDRPELVPLHRIDRATAGLVMLSCNPETRARYQALFRERQIVKHYEALAPALTNIRFPCVRRSRLTRAHEFFRMQEVAGEPNTETTLDVIERGATHWRYALTPVTGKKHQLRVHLAALGAAILGDRLYPTLQPEAPDDHAHPLQLLARALELTDPLTGKRRRFESELALRMPTNA